MISGVVNTKYCTGMGKFHPKNNFLPYLMERLRYTGAKFLPPARGPSRIMKIRVFHPTPQ